MHSELGLNAPPPPLQMLAIREALGTCKLDDKMLWSFIWGAFAFEDAGADFAALPSKPEITAANAATDAAFASVRAALAHAGNGLAAGQRARIEAKLAEAEAMLELERVKADTLEDVRQLFGRRPDGRGKKLAVGGLAVAFKLATGRHPTISTDPVSREMSGPFVDFVQKCCGIVGATITDAQLDKGLREHKERLARRSTARSTSNKTA